MVTVLVKPCGHRVHGVCQRCEKKATERVIRYLIKHGVPRYPPSEVHVALACEFVMRYKKALHEVGLD
ncbi:MAG TPA: hypothetical protein VGS11_00960 [Candidatus Bathyarchaeia archaeon]|nr:hypothetical protein [Candidatus Bathyarchaeia archaeon]